MFGAVLGPAALANSDDNYSHYSYGGLNDYGLRPATAGAGPRGTRRIRRRPRWSRGWGGHAREAVAAIGETPDNGVEAPH